MAIYHCSVKVVSRGAGRSSVGASAYRAGEKIHNQKDGLTHDYSKRTGVEHTEMMAPKHAPDWASDRKKLWNEVEKIEKAKNSQLAREVVVALPNELGKQARIDLVKDYAKENFVDKGMVADIALHNKGDGNPHAHIMLTMRPFEQDGSWGSKSKKEYILDEDGNKTYTQKGNARSKKIDTVDWNKKETLEQWRENWAKQANKYLEKEGIQERIDHRSYEDRGIDKLAQVHEGHKVRAMEKRGIKTEVGEMNRAISKQNQMIELIDKQIKLYENRTERSLNNGRTGTDGTQNRDFGNERSNGREAAADRILFGCNQGRQSGADNTIEQGKSADGQDRQSHGRIKEKLERSTADQGEIDRGFTDGLRQSAKAQKNELSEDRRDMQESIRGNEQDMQENVRGNGQEPEEPHGDVEADKGDGVSSQVDTEPELEGEGEAVWNAASNDDRTDSSRSGGNTTGNPIKDILDSVESAIKTANAEEQTPLPKLKRPKKTGKLKKSKAMTQRSHEWDLER